MLTPQLGAPDVNAVVLAFMIADIRGYSRFSAEYGDAAAAALATRFADLARDAVEARGGTVVELRGDEAFATFPTADQAVRAAAEFQLTCIEESDRDPSLPLLIGVGIDVGPAVPVEDGYRGIAINLAARLCSAAGVNQILVTAAAAEQAAGIGDEVELSPRGSATFKGFAEPVSLVEARARWKAAQLDDLAVPAEPLPPELVDPIPLVGRIRELRGLRGTWREVRRGRGRIVVVSGPAGIGKTRLAAEVAAHVQQLGGATHYAGPGGPATARALAAVAEAREAQIPRLIVVDQLDVIGADAVAAVGEAVEDIQSRPVLLLLLVRDPTGTAELADLVDRCGAAGGHRHLSPLSVADVAEVVALYAGEASSEAPVEMIVRASRGVPAVVHEQASEWARSETSRRLEAAAEFMASARGRRAADLRFANNVIGLKLGRLYAAEGAQLPPDVQALGPYKGLAPFEEDDAPWFFGREQLVGELAARIVASGALGVLGASGSGKSSVVAAGLLPSLRAGLLPGSSRWSHVSMRPGNAPMAALRKAMSSEADDPVERAIGALGPDGRLVLVVDQFEEVFTACDDEAERSEFLDLLASHAVQHAEQFVLVATLRSDFYGDLATYPALAGLFADNHVLVGPLSRAELQRIVQLPAQRAGVRIETALVDALVDEATGEPGALPLLSTALVELWQARSGGWIRAAAYDEGGGIRGAVSRIAESSYAELDEAEQAAARPVLLRLASSTEGDAPTRRRVELDEFDLDRAVSARRVIERFITDRLLTVSGTTVEVAHEALLREWPRLRRWLEEDVQGRQLRSHLTGAAKGWDAAGKERSELYRGARLTAALEWAGDHPADLNDLERAFLNASREASQAEAEVARRTNRRLRRAAVALAAVLAVAVAGGIVALVERESAQTQAHRARAAALVADARRLAALSANAPDTASASQLALAAYRLDDTLDTRAALLAAVERTGGALWRAKYPQRTFDVTATADGSRVALRSGPEVVVVDGRTRTQVARFPARADQVVGLTSDGRQIVTLAHGSLLVRAGPSGRLVRVLTRAGDANYFAVRSYGGRWFAVITTKHIGTGVVVDVFDSRDWNAPPAEFVTLGQPVTMEASAGSIAVEHDDGSVEVRALSSLRRIGAVPAVGEVTSPEPSFSVAVSPDGSHVARSDPNDATSVAVYDVHRPGQAVSRLPTIPVGGAVGLHFSPDGAELAVASADGHLGVYRSANGSLVNSFAGNSGQLLGLTWAGVATPSALYSVGLDGELISWDIGTQPRLVQESGPAYPDVHVSVLTNVALDGSRHVGAFTDSPDGPLPEISLDLQDGAITRWPADSRSNDQPCCATLSLSSNGRLALQSVPEVATDPSQNGPTRNDLWDLRNGKLLWSQTVTPPPTGEAEFNTIINPAGTRAYVNLSRTRIGVYALPSGTQVRTFTAHLPGTDSSLVVAPWAVDPAGRLLVNRGSNGPDNRLGLVDPSSGRVLASVELGDIAAVMSQSWSNDHRLLAVGTFTGTLFILDAQTLAVRAKLNGAEPGAVRSISFSPDDNTVVSTDETGDLDFWTVDGLDREAHIRIGDNRVWAWYDAHGRLVGLAPDPSRPGKDIARWFTFRSDPASLAAEACTLAGNYDLGRKQWQHYVADQPYRRICP